MTTPYQILKATVPNFCPTCKTSHNAERHAKYQKHRKRYVTRLREEGSYCNTCVGYHNPTYHQHRLEIDRDRERSSYVPVGPPPPEYYPYGQPISPLLATVIEAVTRNLPEEVRAETCQEMLLAILEGRLKLDDTSLRAEEFIKATYRTLFDGWKIRSIYEPNSKDSKIQIKDSIQDVRLFCDDCGAPTDFGECLLCRQVG